MAKDKAQPTVSARDLAPKRDLFFVDHKEPGFVYRHAADNPIRIRELELDGYEVVTGGKEVIGSPLGLQSDATAGPLNLPGHRLMRTTKKNFDRLQADKDARLRIHEQDIKDQVDSMKAMVERRGAGRMKARLKGDEIEF